LRKTFLSKIEGLGKISMDLPGWGKNPALSRSEPTPVRRCGGPGNRGNLNFGVGRVPARTQSTSMWFAGSTSAFLANVLGQDFEWWKQRMGWVRSRKVLQGLILEGAESCALIWVRLGQNRSSASMCF
jgi:hypothetical protein